MAMKRATKEIEIDELTPEEALTVRVAILEHKSATQAVELLVAQHGHAMIRARETERALSELQEQLRATHRLGPADKVDVDTRAITRGAPKGPMP